MASLVYYDNSTGKKYVSFVKTEVPTGFTSVAPPSLCLTDGLLATFNGTTSVWTIDPESQAEYDREEGIETEQSSSGIKDLTVEEAKQIIDNRMAMVTDYATLKTQCTWIYKKMIPYLLE